MRLRFRLPITTTFVRFLRLDGQRYCRDAKPDRVPDRIEQDPVVKGLGKELR